MAVSCLRIRAELGLDHRQDTGGTPANEDEAVFFLLKKKPLTVFLQILSVPEGGDNIPHLMFYFIELMSFVFCLHVL